MVYYSFVSLVIERFLSDLENKVIYLNLEFWPTLGNSFPSVKSPANTCRGAQAKRSAQINTNAICLEKVPFYRNAETSSFCLSRAVGAQPNIPIDRARLRRYKTVKIESTFFQTKNLRVKQSGKKSVYRSEPFSNTSKHSRAKLKIWRCRAKLGKTFVRDMYYSISHTFRDKNSQSQPISSFSFRVISKTENIFQNVFSQPPVN